MMAGELSVEPSSMQMASKSMKVCFEIDSRHCCRYFSVLYMGMIIEIGGVNDSPFLQVE